MQKLARSVIITGASFLLGFSALRPASAADLALVVVPQGMILETRLASKTPAVAPPGTPIDFVVTHELNVGDHVVIAAGSHGVGHFVRGGRGRTRAGYDYVVASDGTRIPVGGALPYLTTRASATVVIYGVAGADPQTPAATLATRRDAPL